MCPITVALGWFTARRDAVPGQTAVAAAIEQSTAVQLTASIVARKAAHGRLAPDDSARQSQQPQPFMQKA